MTLQGPILHKWSISRLRPLSHWISISIESHIAPQQPKLTPKTDLISNFIQKLHCILVINITVRIISTWPLFWSILTKKDSSQLIVLPERSTVTHFNQEPVETSAYLIKSRQWVSLMLVIHKSQNFSSTKPFFVQITWIFEVAISSKTNKIYDTMYFLLIWFSCNFCSVNPSWF